jgi:exopolyphosphatase/guanosine-5'-triphosphate,3'-diphosphate pyrophosphatase
MTRLAAVDVGSNSVLMAVAEAFPGGDYRILYESFRSTRLGEALDRTGHLSPTAIERTLGALRECRRKAEIFGAKRIRAVATAAVREAGNPDDFLRPATEALGVEVEAISGRREAELTFLGSAGDVTEEPVIVLDVGGRSTEIILARQGEVESIHSLPVGAVRVREAVPSEDGGLVAAEVSRALPEELRGGRTASRKAVVVGGTATTLAAMHLELRRYHGDRVEGLALHRDLILHLVERVRRTEPGERANIPGLPASRVDIIVSGGLVLARLLEELGTEEAAVSSRGLRHGLLWELARKEA